MSIAPKTIRALTKVFFIFGPNLVILAWTGPGLLHGQASDWRTDGRTDTHTHTQTQATTITGGQNWPRVKIVGCVCDGNAGNVFPCRRLQRKPLVSDPGMYYGTCVTHVSWCMSGSLTRGGGENVPGIPGTCAPAIVRIWQEAHDDARSQSISNPGI